MPAWTNWTPGSCRPLLRLKYNHAIADAVAELGPPAEIGATFCGFQKFLYRDDVA